MLIFRGLALVVLGNANIGSFPAEYRALGNGFLTGSFGETRPRPDHARSSARVAIVALIVQQVRTRAAARSTARRSSRSAGSSPSWCSSRSASASSPTRSPAYKGIPVTLIVLAVLVLIYGIIMNRSVFGRHIYAIGGNRHAAELSGIKTRQVDFLLFVNMGVLAALAGLIFTARLNLAGPKAGDGFELEAISAAFIGGAAVQGGVGTIGGAIIGGLIIGVLNNGMSIMGIGIEWQQAVKGLVLLLRRRVRRLQQAPLGRSLTGGIRVAPPRVATEGPLESIQGAFCGNSRERGTSPRHAGVNSTGKQRPPFGLWITSPAAAENGRNRPGGLFRTGGKSVDNHINVITACSGRS